MPDTLDHAKWEDVVGSMSKSDVCLEETLSSYLFENPVELSQHLAVFKFISKLIGSNKKILQLGLNHAFESLILEKECGAVTICSEDSEKVFATSQNWPNLDLQPIKFPKNPSTYDVVILNPFTSDEYLDGFIDLSNLLKFLQNKGLFFCGFKGTAKYKDEIFSQIASNFKFSFEFSVNGDFVTAGKSNQSDFTLLMAYSLA